MPGQKKLEDRLDICCQNIQSRISIMEAYAEDAYAVDVQGLISLAVILSNVNINQQIMLSDNTVHIIGELKHLLKEEKQRCNFSIQLEDRERTNKTEEEIKSRILVARQQNKINPYQVESQLSSRKTPPTKRQISGSEKQIN